MAREIDMEELSGMIVKEVAQVEKDLSKRNGPPPPDKGEKVEADEYAKKLVHKVDYEKALSINPKMDSKGLALESLRTKESKAIRFAKALREQRKALQAEINKEKIVAENNRLREAIKKFKQIKK
jgi:hypothetical protein